MRNKCGFVSSPTNWICRNCNHISVSLGGWLCITCEIPDVLLWRFKGRLVLLSGCSSQLWPGGGTMQSKSRTQLFIYLFLISYHCCNPVDFVLIRKWHVKMALHLRKRMVIQVKHAVQFWINFKFPLAFKVGGAVSDGSQWVLTKDMGTE